MTQPPAPSEQKSRLNPKKLGKNKKQLDQYAKYSGIAMQMAVVIFLGVFGGVKLDRLLGLGFPVLTLVLSLVSVSLAVYLAIKDFLKMK